MTLEDIKSRLTIRSWDNPKVIFGLWFAACMALAGVYLATSTNKDSGDAGAGYFSNNGSTSGLNLVNSSNQTCNVVGITLHGQLITYVPSWWKDDQSLSADEKNVVSSEYIMAIIDEAQKDQRAKAIVLEVDSGGGSPVAGEEIANAIKRSQKPVVGLIRGIGASASYWAVSPAKPIFASKNSDVGSIGVTASYMQDIDDKKKFVELAVGKYKDTGNPNKPLTEEEKGLIMRDVRIVQQNFIDAIVENRGLDREKVRALADGSTVLGASALSAGLIDTIGSIYDVENYLQTKINEEPIICWF